MSKLCIILCNELHIRVLWGGKKETELFLPSDEPILKLVPVASFENEVIRMKF